MKPLVLTLHAFGPFQGTQTIDFNEVSADGIFLVTGKTGSGKTTIFDAVAFALYGEPSGSVRQSDSLKSDFAPLGETCWAELSFLSRGEKYSIRRAPQQTVLKRSGEPRIVSATAELTLPNGQILSGKNEVDQKVVEVLGLTKDQFRKIVLLPQGEFRSFLDADSKTRQEIFRRIFSTERYARFTEQLGERSKELERRCRELSAASDGVLRTLSTDNGEIRSLLEADAVDLPLLTHKLSGDLAARRARAEEQKALLDALKAELAAIDLKEAKTVNQKLKKLDETRLSLEDLARQRPFYDSKREQAARLRRVQTLSVLEQQLLDARQRLSAALSGLKETESALPKAQAELEEAVRLQKKSQQKQEELPALSARIAALENAVRLLSDRTTKEAELEQCRAQGKKLHRQLACLKLLEQRAILFQEDDSLREKQEKLSALPAVVEAYRKAMDEAAKASARYVDMMNRYASRQAGELAKSLRPGEPCPVCGSREHPAPATLEGVPTPAQREESLQTMTGLREQAQEQTASCTKALSGLSEEEGWDLRNDRLLSLIEKEKAETANQRAALAENLAAVEDQLYQLGAESALSRRDFLSPDFLASKRSDVQSKQAAAKARQEALETALRELSEKLPPDSGDDLLARLDELQKQAKQITETAQKAQTAFQQATLQKDRLEKREESLRETQKAETARLQTASEAFQKELSAAGYPDADAYRAEKGELSSLPALEEELKRYDSAVQRGQILLEQLSAQVAGKKPYPLEEMEQKQRELSARLTETENAFFSLQSSIGQDEKALSYLKKNLSSLQKADEQFRTVGTLYKLSAGMNQKNLSFERFVLGGFFDEIIENANRRLLALSSGRYSVSRKQEKEKGRRASGLDLEVLDVYTGKYRGTNTLSGGESFLTSLALALAVADVISAVSGGVEVNTMFIDEGFGSLDAESLETAVESLLSLRESGRLIGIISHVQTLSDYIPARIEVTASPKGSVVKTVC